MAQRILLVASGDARPEANLQCWPAQQALERDLGNAVRALGFDLERAHDDNGAGHGFIDSQKYVHTAARRAGAETRRAPNTTARAGGSGQWPLPWGSQALGPERAVGGIGPIRSSRHAPRPLAARKAGAGRTTLSGSGSGSGSGRVSVSGRWDE